MLDNKTKKNIDDCRDVLVGKVPDPKSQIEQITIALIYKFMDDMDKEAVEKFKGKAKFFAPPIKTGNPEIDDKQVDYSEYSWRKLFNQALSGAELIVLYGDALEKLSVNPNVPELFRNIFKNAYLPYRDPATLKLFLKHISEFEYSHSEKLGDAFEYLLSVMGSQGDAGQFRTPRNIIDFITACVNPQKGETILDPACGTAGFLLSAYKHILSQNIEKQSGDKLTPDERTKLSASLVGYDISPDMVRLSLANMFLHGFTTPQIHEYDTLSSEDRWSETYDVILANPPFMTPKGGIRPHKKFGVQANKAEVLFTDYITEHLSRTGRAGIIVPNGIVATSQIAYKQLRKLLVQDSLIAVVSLPAGCFNPYSGVKTSVLLLDKQLAKKSKHILFLKVENDGFDLGAQRREINKNDLPLALEAFEAYKQALDQNETFDENKYFSLASLVGKSTILENKDTILNGERYVEGKLEATDHLMKPLSEFVIFTQTGLVRNKAEQSDFFKYPYLKMDNITYQGELKLSKTTNVSATIDEFEKYNLKKGDFIYNTRNAPDLVGKSCVFNGDENKYLFNNNLMRVRYDSRLNPFFVNHVLNTPQYKEELKKFIDGTTSVAAIYPKNFFSIEIPVPSIEIQEQIVKEIESYQKIVDGAKQIVNNYKPNIIINQNWDLVYLGELATLIGGGTPSKEVSTFWENGTIDWITCSDFSSNDMYLKSSIRKITEEGLKSSSANLVPDDTLILITRVSLGKMAFVSKPTALNQDLTGLIINEEKANKRFVYYYLLSIADKIAVDGHGATVKGVTRDYVKAIQMPLPSIDEQKEIVKRIDEEQALVNDNKKLLQIFEQKIKDKINAVWGVKEEADQAKLV